MHLNQNCVPCHDPSLTTLLPVASLAQIPTRLGELAALAYVVLISGNLRYWLGLESSRSRTGPTLASKLQSRLYGGGQGSSRDRER
jgi:hypothetical protein